MNMGKKTRANVTLLFVVLALGLADAARRRVRSTTATMTTTTTTTPASFVGRQLGFAGQPEELETLWDNYDIQKLDSRSEIWKSPNNTLGHQEVIFGKQYPGFPVNPGDTNELPGPISPQPSPPPQKLPPGCLGSRGQYSSLKSCADYLNCWDDVVIEQTCPAGLLFNDIINVCDFPYNVKCGERPPATPKPPLPAGSKQCPDPNGRYRSSTNCSEFYVCVAGKPCKFSCPDSLVYNDMLGICDYTYNVDCKGTATPRPTQLPSTEPSQSPSNLPTYAPQLPPSNLPPSYGPQPTKPPQSSSRPPQPPSRPPQPPSRPPQPPSRPPQPPSRPTLPPTKPTQPPSNPTRPSSKPTQPPSKPAQPPSKPPTYNPPQPPTYAPPPQPPAPQPPTYAPPPELPSHASKPPTYAPPPQPPTYAPQPQPPSYGPQQPPSYGPQQPPSYSPQQPPSYGPQQPPSYGPQQPPSYGPQQPPSYGSQQPPTYAPPLQPPTYAPQSQPPSYQPQLFSSPHLTPWQTNIETDSWQQQSVASQVEKKRNQAEVPGDEGQPLSNPPAQSTTETPNLTNPWSIFQIISPELMNTPCNNGDLHRLNDSCTNVLVCRNNKLQVVKCLLGFSYDRPTDSCRPISVAKC